MEKTTDNNYPATIEDLIVAMQEPSGRYKHLQLMFYRNKSSLGLGFGQKYLVVNRNGFGLYELNSVDYNNGILQMLFTNPATGNTAEVNLDVNVELQSTFLFAGTTSRIWFMLNKPTGVLTNYWNSILINMENKLYINSAGRKILEYATPNTIVLDLQFIMTSGKRLTKSMPYMKLEKKVIGEEIVAIRLLNFQDYEGVIYLNVQDLKTNKCYNLSWNMEYDGEWWFWSLADL